MKPTILPTYYGSQPNGDWVFADCILHADGSTSGPFSKPAIPNISTGPELCVPFGCPDAGQVIQEFFTTLQAGFGDNVAKHMLGIVFAYAAAPALLAASFGHPGLWFVGKAGAGKTSVSAWLGRIWGVQRENFINMTATSSAITRYLGERSSLPIRLDDYRPTNVNQGADVALRSGFDRTPESAVKTSPFVCSETPCTDAATRDRFFHVDFGAVKRSLRAGVEFSDCNQHSAYLPSVGLRLLHRRESFTAVLIQALRSRSFDSRADYIDFLAERAFTIGMQFLIP